MQSPFQRRRLNVGWRCWQKLGWRRSTSLEESPSLSSGWSAVAEKVNGVNYCYDCRLTPTFKLDAVWEHPWQENPHNFSRGGRHLGEMVRFCKEELDIESVTVVTNGSKVEKEKNQCPIFFPTEFFLHSQRLPSSGCRTSVTTWTS